MIPHVLLIDDNCDLHELLRIGGNHYRAVVALFWGSSETKELISDWLGGSCYFINDFVGDTNSIEMGVTEFVQGFCDEGPKHMGLTIRKYLSEQLFRNSLYPVMLSIALDFIERLRIQWKVDRLEAELVISDEHLSMVMQSGIEGKSQGHLNLMPHPKRDSLSQRRPPQMPLLERLTRQLQGARITGQWKSQLYNLIEKGDKNYAKRSFFSQLRKSDAIPSLPITFFSSYLNNSRILQSFEGLMPYPVHWVVTNYYARKPIVNKRKHVNWIWSFGRCGTKGMKLKDSTVLNDLGNHLNGNDVLKTYLSNSGTLRNWTNGQLNSLVNLTHCWENYLKEVKPRLIVMANQWGIEGWFSQIAKKRRIPVLQVMHGVLGGHFYTKTSVNSDAMVTPGEFWRDLWPSDQRAKILVYNPENSFPLTDKRLNSDKRRLTFFSWPLRTSDFYNLSEFNDRFIKLFHKLLIQGNTEVRVRAHPLENPDDFIKHWGKYYGPLPKGVHVGKYEPLTDILAQTDVALMFRSTVMLNCLINRIPVIIPGWVNMGWDQRLLNTQGLYLAPDFEELENRLIRWLDNPPKMESEASEYLVRAPGAGQEEFCCLVNNLIAVR